MNAEMTGKLLSASFASLRFNPRPKNMRKKRRLSQRMRTRFVLGLDPAGGFEDEDEKERDSRSRSEQHPFAFCVTYEDFHR